MPPRARCVQMESRSPIRRPTDLQMIIQAHDIWKTYGRFGAVQGLSLAVPEGSIYALIGPSGAGKTTLIKILMNILTPTRGTASILGVDSRELGPRVLENIGYVSENQELPGRLKVGDCFDYLRPYYPRWDAKLETELRGQLRLPAERRIRHLSHGMRLKMALACALSFRPRLLVLDEPFSGLDALVRDELTEGFLRQAAGLTVLISSHELAEIERIATHVAFLNAGRLLFQGTTEELSEHGRAIGIIPGDDHFKRGMLRPTFVSMARTARDAAPWIRPD
jgi:ABC-2 type transport system ATP-binding protein